jgi:aminoglycoside 3-N-acetyltransferase I
MEIKTKRLTLTDKEEAKNLFTTMAEIFAEEFVPLNDRYVEQLLRRDEFWALAALADNFVVGGVIAHELLMTRSESSELFVYDIAVRPNYQRKGIGRRLFTALSEEASKAGIQDVFVSADDDDVHALDFYRNLGGVASPVTMFDFPRSLRARPSDSQ